jgi:hypothetical protein
MATISQLSLTALHGGRVTLQLLNQKRIHTIYYDGPEETRAERAARLYTAEVLEGRMPGHVNCPECRAEHPCDSARPVFLDHTRCKVCFDDVSSFRVWPCGHGACPDCATALGFGPKDPALASKAEAFLQAREAELATLEQQALAAQRSANLAATLLAEEPQDMERLEAHGQAAAALEAAEQERHEAFYSIFQSSGNIPEKSWIQGLEVALLVDGVESGRRVLEFHYEEDLGGGPPPGFHGEVVNPTDKWHVVVFAEGQTVHFSRAGRIRA